MADPIPVLFEPTGRRIRVKFGGEIIADSKQAMLLRDSRVHLAYYFPLDDVRMEFLTATDHTTESPYKGKTVHWTVKVGDQVAENAAYAYPEVKEKRPDMRGYLTFQWKAMAGWYEEDEQVFGHPRDPYHRVDTLQSSRHIRVEIEGLTVAETRQPVLLFETQLPTRYYMPMEDVQMGLFTPTDSHTYCPYKGQASYWTFSANESEVKDIVWSYLDPLPEIPKIRGLLSFYNEKVDIYVDGVLEERPRTVFR